VDADDPRVPTTRPTLAFPSALAAGSPSLNTADASLVILIDEVLLARIASGRSVLESDLKMDIFNGSDSDTA
jgi:hypothetical protein